MIKLVYSKDSSMVQNMQTDNLLQHINRIGNRNYMIISTDGEKPLTKFNMFSL
jgi:hypothetical protein